MSLLVSAFSSSSKVLGGATDKVSGLVSGVAIGVTNGVAGGVGENLPVGVGPFGESIPPIGDGGRSSN